MEIPKTFLICEKNIRCFNKHCCAVMKLAFSAKFGLEQKVKKRTF